MIALSSITLFETEIKKYQTKNMTIIIRAIIIPRNNFLRKYPNLALNLDLALVSSISSGEAILKTTVKNNY
jgi:hypothetical protein